MRTKKQIGPIKGLGDPNGVGQPEYMLNILPRLWCGSGSERNGRRIAQGTTIRSQRSIMRAKIVAPFTDAVRFVDSKSGHPEPWECLEQPLHAFGRDVQHREAIARECSCHRTLRFPRLGAAQIRCGNSARLKRCDLILHE